MRHSRNSGKQSPTVVQIVGNKNSGKTTLICALIPLLREQGYTVAVIKHTHHSFEVDHSGTDTWKQREAGAAAVAITDGNRTARIEEQGAELPELVNSFGNYDYILVEGFKQEYYPKLVIIRSKEDEQLLGLSAVTAAALWEPINNFVHLQSCDRIHLLSINDVRGIANHLLQLH
jgi:molybdopterin-guanine dinucleotide biosynthesis adapter protein